MPFLPNRLRGIREAKGLTQQQVQDLTGIDHSRIARYERGNGVPTVDNLDRLARALDITTDYLLGTGLDGVDFATAASRMAFDVFNREPHCSVLRRERCRRVMNHEDAPRTARGWRSLAEMMELGLEPTDSEGENTKFRVMPKRS